MKQKVEGWKGEGKRELQRERLGRRNGDGKEGERKGGADSRMIDREVNLEGGVLLSFGESDLEEDLSQDGWCTWAPIPPYFKLQSSDHAVGRWGKLPDLSLTVQLCAGMQGQDTPAWLQQGPSNARVVGCECT